MTPVCLLEWLSAALLFFPKPSTFLKKKKRAHKEVWKTTSPENKNFSGKGKLAVENHSLPPSIYFSKKVEKAVGTQPEKPFLVEKKRTNKEVCGGEGE